jgi:hypothetical protein
MATITATNLVDLTAAAAVSQTTLTGTDDLFTFSAGSRNILILENGTGGSLSPVLSGTGATIVKVPGLGIVDVSSGTDVFGAIADGTSKAFLINTVKDYLAASVEITGGTGLVATLLVI